MTNEKLSIKEWHTKQAKQCFNGTWDLIDKQDKTEQDIFNMIHKAHASRYHWGEVGEPVNLARGEWQISRVYAIAKLGESALFHAKEYLRYCQEHDLAIFDFAFAYESIARAYMVLGNKELVNKNLQLAKEATSKVENEDNQKYLYSELQNITL